MFYGTTGGGGPANAGTVFQMAPDGSAFTLLHTFGGLLTDGFFPFGSLIQGPDGTLYGTTRQGGGAGCMPIGCGTVFSLAPDGSGFTYLHRFAGGPVDGTDPLASLVQALDGTLYGTTRDGGAANAGMVFQIGSDGTGYAVVYTFGGAMDGSTARANLIQGQDGTLYGSTSDGGAFGFGVLFSLTPGVVASRATLDSHTSMSGIIGIALPFFTLRRAMAEMRPPVSTRTVARFRFERAAEEAWPSVVS
jgi:uncharacterized repeat protein (TIGR03803 family)